MWKRVLPNLALAAVISLAQCVTDLLDRRPGLVHTFSVDRLADANRAMAAVGVAEAVEQIVMAVQTVAVAMKLGKQFRMLARHPIRLVRGSGVEGGVQRHYVAPDAVGRGGVMSGAPCSGSKVDRRQYQHGAAGNQKATLSAFSHACPNT